VAFHAWVTERAPFAARGEVALKNILMSLVMFVGFGTTAACGGGLGSKLEGLAEKACACENVECADKVNAEFEALVKSQTSEPSEADQKAMMGSITKMAGCIAKLRKGAD